MTREMTIPDAVPVKLKDAQPPFVVAIDIGSGSTRCSLYDAYARPIRKRTQKADHAFYETAEGAAEIDADQVTEEVAHVLTVVTEGLQPGLVKAVAMDTFASSLVCVDGEGNALTPCFTYADSRSAPYVEQLRAELSETEVHQRTGTRIHTSYNPSRMLWIRETMPDVWEKTATFMSLGEYVYSKLAGVTGAAVSTVAWSGMLNRHTLDIDEELIDVTGVNRDQFAPVVDPSEPIYEVSPKVAQRWPALEGAPWFPAIPDGFASNLGVGANNPTTGAMSAATSGAMRVIVEGTPDVLPTGLWSYAVSKDASIVGGALNDVGRMTFWMQRTFAKVPESVIDEALRAQPKPGTPLVLPFLTGERATGWATNARAVFAGVSSATKPVDFWRGASEGIAISYARIFDQLREVNPNLQRMIASGGGAQHYPGAMSIVAQAIGFPVQVVDVRRVTMRGNAVLALSVIDPEQQMARIPQTELTLPDPSQRPYYDNLRERFETVYKALFG